MSENKIVDLSQYRKTKAQTDKDAGPPNQESLSFEEKLQDLIHRPFGEPGSKKELIDIFEEEQLKEDEED